MWMLRSITNKAPGQISYYRPGGWRWVQTGGQESAGYWTQNDNALCGCPSVSRCKCPIN